MDNQVSLSVRRVDALGSDPLFVVEAIVNVVGQPQEVDILAVQNLHRDGSMDAKQS